MLFCRKWFLPDSKLKAVAEVTHFRDTSNISYVTKGTGNCPCILPPTTSTDEHPPSGLLPWDGWVGPPPFPCLPSHGLKMIFLSNRPNFSHRKREHLGALTLSISQALFQDGPFICPQPSSFSLWEEGMRLCRASGEPGLLALLPGSWTGHSHLFVVENLRPGSHVTYCRSRAMPTRGCILTDAVAMRNVQMRSSEAS